MEVEEVVVVVEAAVGLVDVVGVAVLTEEGGEEASEEEEEEVSVVGVAVIDSEYLLATVT